MNFEKKPPWGPPPRPFPPGGEKNEGGGWGGGGGGVWGGLREEEGGSVFFGIYRHSEWRFRPTRRGPDPGRPNYQPRQRPRGASKFRHDRAEYGAAAAWVSEGEGEKSKTMVGRGPLQAASRRPRVPPCCAASSALWSCCESRSPDWSPSTTWPLVPVHALLLFAGVQGEQTNTSFWEV